MNEIYYRLHNRRKSRLDVKPLNINATIVTSHIITATAEWATLSFLFFHSSIRLYGQRVREEGALTRALWQWTGPER